jgi:hypothetical protein
MFSVIANFYYKKNQKTCINGIVHRQRKIEKDFFDN